MSTPETIYLIPGEYEEGLVWCDDPAPDSYSDPDEAVKYVRADHIPDAGKVITDNSKVNAGLIAENERLQARLAMLEDFVADAQLDALRALGPDYVPKEVEQAMKSLLERCKTITCESDPDDIEPTAFIKRKQAEALCACAEELKMSNRYEDPIFIRGMATAHGFITGTAQTLIDEAAKAEGADNAG